MQVHVQWSFCQFRNVTKITPLIDIAILAKVSIVDLAFVLLRLATKTTLLSICKKSKNFPILKVELTFSFSFGVLL